MNWLRLYDDILDDPKVQRLPAPLFKQWINLLCIASKNNPRGTLPNVEAISFRLRMSLNQTSVVLEQLSSAGLVDRNESGCYEPHNWSGRQRVSDDIAERVRKHRSGVTGNGSVTLHETPQKRSRAEERERKKQIDTEQRENPPNPPVGGIDLSTQITFGKSSRTTKQSTPAKPNSRASPGLPDIMKPGEVPDDGGYAEWQASRRSE